MSDFYDSLEGAFDDASDAIDEAARRAAEIVSGEDIATDEEIAEESDAVAAERHDIAADRAAGRARRRRWLPWVLGLAGATVGVVLVYTLATKRRHANGRFK